MRMRYLDLDGSSRPRGVRAVEDEPLQLRGGNDGDLVHHGIPEQHAVEGRQAVVGDERKELQLGAASEHVLQVMVLHDAVTDAELPEVGEGGVAEAGRVRELPDADVEAGEGGDGEERTGEGHIGWRRAVDEDELLDAPGSEETEPASELGLALAHADVDEVDGAEGPRVRGEDAGDGRGDGGGVGRGPGAVGEVGIVEDERRRAPDPAPARGEHGGAGGVLGREAGDDVAEERVGEAADAVYAVGGGGAAGGEVGGGGDGRVREGGVDDRHELFQHIRIDVGERCAEPASHGREREVSTSSSGRVLCRVWTE